MRPLFAVGLVFAGCCSNVIFLELLVRSVTPRVPGLHRGSRRGVPTRLPHAPRVRPCAAWDPESPLLHPAQAPSAAPANSFTAPLAGNTRGVAGITPFSHTWGIESGRTSHVTGQNLVAAEPKVPLALFSNRVVINATFDWSTGPKLFDLECSLILYTLQRKSHVC